MDHPGRSLFITVTPIDPAAERRLRASLLFASALALSACATDDFGAPLDFDPPGTAVAYETELEGAPSEEVAELLQETLSLFRRQEDGAQSLAFLRRRARDDVDAAQRVLRSFGYYSAEVDVVVIESGAVEEEAPEGTAPAEDLPGDPPFARVVVEIDPGPQFTLARHEFVLTDFGPTPPEPLQAEAVGSPVGGPAIARLILDAEATAVQRLRREGRPYAEFAERDSVADLDAAEVAVESTIFSGPPVVFGGIEFRGLEEVEADYLRSYRTFEPGAPWDAAGVAEYQGELVETNLFNVVRATPPEAPPEGEAAPVIVTVEERPFRTVSAGVRYSTDRGPAVRGAFEHRNLFGENEQFRAEALASGLASGVGGVDSSQLGDGLELSLDLAYREPQYLRPGQDLLLGFNARRIEDDAFDETAATLTAGLERELTPSLFVGGGGLLEFSEITDDGETNQYYLGGLPLFVRYDGVDDLLDPTEGVRWRVDATPFAGFRDDDETPLFLRMDAYGSAYLGLDADDDYVLAGRGRLGSIIVDDRDMVPRSRRLYSGGGGSIRGYEERSIGPLDEDDDPQGGLSVVELVGELRARVYGDFGLVAFAGAGAVGEDSYPNFDEEPQYAAGLGARYYSPVGPIRVDVAFPLNPRDTDDAWQLYLSIGQAF